MKLNFVQYSTSVPQTIRSECSTTLSVNPSKVLDAVDHELLLNKLINAGFHSKVAIWFRTFPVNKIQCADVIKRTTELIS